MTYAEAVQSLQELQLFGARFGLETIRRLAALAGNPQEKLRFIHVAGTNGKGSVCAMLESIYRTAGLRVGLFTSPHLVSFTERVQIDRRNIPEAEVVRWVGTMRPWLGSFPAGQEPTFFEAVTLLALLRFAEQKVDLVIWETGLGGRLDATNLVTPLASVITTIGRDHEQWLGGTLAAIASEKAGIIKPGVPVITGVTEAEPLGVIAREAARQGSELIRAGETVWTKDIALPAGLSVPYQERNAAVARATVERLRSVLPVTDEAIRHGLGTVSWPGRMQVVRRGARTLLLDGAHNADGARALRAALERGFPGQRPALVLGAMADKDLAGLAAALAPAIGSLCATRLASPRGAEPAALTAAFRQAGFDGPLTVAGSLTEALERTSAEPFVVITGSLYFVGEAVEALGLMDTPVADEKGLNDWQADRSKP